MPDLTASYRVQLSRRKGWTMPANTLKVDRSTRWGNPFTPQQAGSIERAVAQHAAWMRGDLDAPDGRAVPTPAAIRAALRGHHLACWCALNGPCHADLLLKIANDE